MQKYISWICCSFLSVRGGNGIHLVLIGDAMKAMISCFICLVLLGGSFVLVHAARPGGKAPEQFKTVNDENFNMIYDGAELSVAPKKLRGLTYVCGVAGKFPNIMYTGDYAVTGPYNPNEPERATIIIQRKNGRKFIVLRQQDKIVAEAQRRGVNAKFPPDDIVEQYTTTYDVQSAIIPKNLEQIDKMVRPEIEKTCTNFVNYAIQRLKN